MSLRVSGGSFLFPSIIYKMERECTWCLEIELKQAEVILQREKWNFFEAISLTYP